jgi:hypothetical protein
LFGVRQFQPRAANACQVWLVPWASETAAVAPPVALAGTLGLFGAWLQAATSAHAVATAATRARATADIVLLLDNSVIARMLSPC